MTTTTSHTTPDTRLIASSGAAEGEPRSSGKGRVCSKSLPLPPGRSSTATEATSVAMRDEQQAARRELDCSVCLEAIPAEGNWATGECDVAQCPMVMDGACGMH
jgi:hypothetical protein